MSIIDIEKLLGEPPDFLINRVLEHKRLAYVEHPQQEHELAQAKRVRSVANSVPRAIVWEHCWQQCLDRYKQSGFLVDLLPKFLRTPEQPYRYFGKYILGHGSLLYSVQKSILSHLLVKWMRGSALVEFGCGSGYNLALARKWVDQETVLCGLDWSPAAIECVKLLGFGGALFDMRSPAEPVTSSLPWYDTTVLTAGAMEQLGSNFAPFLNFLLARRPCMCIHVEPLLELYDLDPMDAEAAKYHTARGYLTGFLPALQQLQRDGRVQICELHRTHFGARFNDGFSWVVWRPQ